MDIVKHAYPSFYSFVCSFARIGVHEKVARKNERSTASKHFKTPCQKFEVCTPSLLIGRVPCADIEAEERQA